MFHYDTELSCNGITWQRMSKTASNWIFFLIYKWNLKQDTTRPYCFHVEESNFFLIRFAWKYTTASGWSMHEHSSNFPRQQKEPHKIILGRLKHFQYNSFCSFSIAISLSNRYFCSAMKQCTWHDLLLYDCVANHTIKGQTCNQSSNNLSSHWTF